MKVLFFNSTSKCSQQTLTSFIRRRTPTVKFVKESKHELHYMLSLSELKAGRFVKLFKDLEKFKEDLHISSYGVKNTTLEEIFMKVISERLDSESDIWPTESNEQLGRDMASAEPELQMTGQKENGNEEFIKLQPISKASSSKETLANGSISSKEVDSVADVTRRVSQPTDTSDVEESNLNEDMDSQDFLPDRTFNGSNMTDDPRLNPKYPVWQQFCAIIKKRYLCTKRNLEGLISQVYSLKLH